MAQTKTVRSNSDRLDLNTRYYRVVVWNRLGEVQWLLQCRPEHEARAYAKTINACTRATGYRAEMEPISLGALPETLTSKVAEGGVQ